MSEPPGRLAHVSISLTPFERRILELRGSGSDRNDIARICHLSPQAISKALTVAKEKLGARTLTEAAVIFAKLRIGVPPGIVEKAGSR